MGRGGVREGAGRKKMSISTKKTVQVAFRVTEEQKKIILEKAKNQNLSLSEYLVKLALEN